MEDAFKLRRNLTDSFSNQGDSQPGSLPFDEPVQKPAQEPIDRPACLQPEDRGVPKSQKALNRWLSERRTQGRKGLVNVLNETHVTQFGPLKLKGNITLIHEDGTLELANQLTLCRCGHSKNKPFCDDQHIEAEFKDSGRFMQGSQALAPPRPASLAVTCVENGPYQFVGRMVIRDPLGAECTKPKGKLCRCGQSANKPFCDGSHERIGFRTAKTA